MLATAATRRVPNGKSTRLTAPRSKRFFLKGTGEQMGFTHAAAGAEKMVEFRQVNLVDAYWNIEGPLAAIFCRNVMIYFNKQTQRSILERFVPLLQPGRPVVCRALGEFLLQRPRHAQHPRQNGLRVRMAA